MGGGAGQGRGHAVICRPKDVAGEGVAMEAATWKGMAPPDKAEDAFLLLFVVVHHVVVAQGRNLVPSLFFFLWWWWWRPLLLLLLCAPPLHNVLRMGGTVSHPSAPFVRPSVSLSKGECHSHLDASIRPPHRTDGSTGGGGGGRGEGSGPKGLLLLLPCPSFLDGDTGGNGTSPLVGVCRTTIGVQLPNRL